jgi:hypothetical protein
MTRLVPIRMTTTLLMAVWFAQSLAQSPQPIRRLGKQPAPVCVAGYVWREAYPRDFVCVTPPRRDTVRQENAAAASRVNPGGGAYGPDTCASGFVWREANPSDHVCVTPQSRTTVAGENAQATGLWVKTVPAPTAGPSSACETAAICQREAQRQRYEADRLRREIAAKQNRLKQAEAEHRRALAQMRRDDEAYARAHPGLGRSTSPMITDNAAPIRRDIGELEAALQKAEQQAAAADKTGAQRSAAGK